MLFLGYALLTTTHFVPRKLLVERVAKKTSKRNSFFLLERSIFFFLQSVIIHSANGGKG
jgi:hypothetical protein